MNNQDKITAQELIIATAKAEIKVLKSRQGKRFKPEKDQWFWFVSQGGVVSLSTWTVDTFCMNCYDNFNCYETEELATKAAVMVKRNNAIIMACLQVDPDFVPDYLSGNQEHYSFGYEAPQNGYKCGWIIKGTYRINNGPCVSTEAKWHEAAALLKEWDVE
jgi:hypothetical protein